MVRLPSLPRETPMDTTKSLLERLRSKYDGCSNYRLAKVLDVSKTALNRYMTHGGGMGSDVGLRLADELGLPHAYVVACLALEREQSDQVKPVWRGIIETLGRTGQTAPTPARARRASKVAAVLLATGIAGLSAMVPPQAEAGVVRGDFAGSVYYGKSRIRGRRRLQNCGFPPILPRRKRPFRRRDFLTPAAFPIVAT